MKQSDLRIALYILLGGLVFTIVAPFVFTRVGIINFSETGAIGDTIGGITSPITNLIGAILVFYALKAQVESNELTRNQFEQQKTDELERKELTYISNQIDIIRSEINDFGFIEQGTENNSPKTPIYNKGAGAIHALIDIAPNAISHCKNFDIDPFSALPSLMFLKMLLVSINSTMEKINNSKISSTDKEHLLSLLIYQYSAKIKSSFEAKIKSDRMTHTFSPEEGHKSESIFTDELYSIVEEIDAKAQKILSSI